LSNWLGEKFFSDLKAEKYMMIKKLSIALIILYCIGILAQIPNEKEYYQVDFRSYYYAGKAYSAGLNPYDAEVLSQMAGATVNQFVYPPLSLPLLRVFSILNFKISFYFFLFLKLIILIGLLYLWKREFLNGDADLLFYIFCLFGFNSTIFNDIWSGNISIFEQGVLWLAFFAFLRNKLLIFCILTTFVATFKFQPILFLALLGFSNDPKKYRYLFATAILFLGIHFISYLLQPEFFKNFIVLASSLDERGIIAPSTLALLKDFRDVLSKKEIIFISPTVIYLVIVTTITTVTWWILKSRVELEEKKVILFMLCLAYALILPRFKIYSYILLLVPSYFIIMKFFSKTSIPILIVLLMFSQHTVLPGFNKLSEYILWPYYPLIMTYCIWLLLVIAIFQRRTGFVQLSTSEKNSMR
jgi:hypothetical protein